MASGVLDISRTIAILFLLAGSTISPVHSSATNQTFHPEEELNKLKMIRARLEEINKPAVRTIQVLITSTLKLAAGIYSVSVFNINK